MSKKSRRAKRQRARQPQTPAAPGRPEQQDPAAQQGAVTPAVPARPAVAQAAPPAYTSRVTGPRRAAPQAGADIDIDARVPYFTPDLRRIAITAGVLIAAIFAASFLVH
jgi:hypothetical protein